MIKKKIFALLIVIAALLTGGLSCDRRNSTEFAQEPILTLAPQNAADSTITYAVPVAARAMTAVLLNADHSAIETGDTVRFTCRHGMFSNNSGLADGINTADYYPVSETQTYFDTLTAYWVYNTDDTVRARFCIKVLPSVAPPSAEVASVGLSASVTELAVRGTGGTEAAVIRAAVKDANGNPVQDGMRVTFTLVNGLGGYLNVEGRSEDTSSTTGGMASVTFNSGTTPGPVEIKAQCNAIYTQQPVLTVQSGPAAHLTITGKEDSVIRDASGSWKMFINTTCTDKYFNPVKDGVALFFEFDTTYQNLKDSASHQAGGVFDTTFSIYNQGMKINSGTSTGKDYTGALNPDWKGTAWTYISYPSSIIFDSASIKAWTFVNGVKIADSSHVNLALPVQILLNITLILPASQLIVTTQKPADTAVITATLKDQSDHPIEGATLSIYSEKGEVLDMYGTVAGRGRTDSNGNVTYAIKFTSQQKPVAPAIEFTNNVTITCLERGNNAKGSFVVSYP